MTYTYKIMSTNRLKLDRYTAKVSSTPRDYIRDYAGGHNFSGDATNCIGENYDLGMAEGRSARGNSFNQHRGGR